MHVAVAASLHGVVGELVAVAWTKLDVKQCSAVGDARCDVEVEACADVFLAVGESLGLRDAGKHVAIEVECLACTEGEAEHVHRHGIPHAVSVGVGSDLSTCGGVVGDGGDDAVLLHAGVDHCHDASLRVLVEVAESQVHAMGEGGLQFGVTDDDVQRVALVGNGLQLCH